MGKPFCVISPGEIKFPFSFLLFRGRIICGGSLRSLALGYTKQWKQDYAVRKNMEITEVERWLRPVLDYEA